MPSSQRWQSDVFVRSGAVLSSPISCAKALEDFNGLIDGASSNGDSEDACTSSDDSTRFDDNSSRALSKASTVSSPCSTIGALTGGHENTMAMVVLMPQSAFEFGGWQLASSPMAAPFPSPPVSPTEPECTSTLPSLWYTKFVPLVAERMQQRKAYKEGKLTNNDFNITNEIALLLNEARPEIYED